MKYVGTIGTQLSGSLAGVTASRNKAGAYFRQRAVPVQPNTQAQIAAKASFGAAAPIYRALPATNKSLWNQFAETNYTPKMKTNTGQYSGFQAFQALFTAYNAQARINRSYDLEVNGAPLAGGDTRVPFIVPDLNPPINTSAPAWERNSTPGDEPFVITSAVMNLDSSFEVTMQVGDGNGEDMTNFLNPYGNKFGFAVFMSNANPDKNMAYSNPEEKLLGYFDAPEATVPGDLNSVQDIRFATTDVIDRSRYQKWPLEGQYVLLSVYTVTDQMQLNRIGVIEVSVQP